MAHPVEEGSGAPSFRPLWRLMPYLWPKDTGLRARVFLWATFLSFPLGFVATLTGWFTAEVGRQPWVVYGHLRTAEAVTPFLTTPQVATSLAVFAAVYTLIFAFGTHYIYRQLRAGPIPAPDLATQGTNPKRPLSVPGASPGVPHPAALEAGE